MSSRLTLSDLRAMLRGAVAEIGANHEWLSRLDSAIGDGDHGTAMLRAMRAIETAIDAPECGTIEDLLSRVAWDIMGIAGGSTGPLLGSFFLGMSEQVGADESLDAAQLVQMVEGGIKGMRMNTQARVGDKTMMDALLPATAALSGSVASGCGPLDALRAASVAAAEGAEATLDMRARFGRARNLGDRVVGHMDPGACSVSLIFAGFVHGLETG